MPNGYQIQTRSRMHPIASWALEKLMSLFNDDEETIAHSLRVTLILSLLDHSLKSLVAAVTHDFGKSKIPLGIRQKPGKLTAAEWEYVAAHPLGTLDLLGKRRLPAQFHDMPFLASAHHEYWNGRGYPWGLRLNQIPDATHRLTLADVTDAVASKRPYKEAKSIPDVFAVLKNEFVLVGKISSSLYRTLKQFAADLAMIAGQTEISGLYTQVSNLLREASSIPVSMPCVTPLQLPLYRRPTPQIPSFASSVTTLAVA